MLIRLHSLRFKIMLASTLVEVLMLSMLMLNAMRLIDQSTLASTEAALRQAVPMLNVATAPYLVQGDYATLQDNLNEIMGSPDQGVIYVVVRDGADQVVAKAGAIDAAKLPPPSADMHEALDKGVLHVERPLSLAGQHVGKLRFGLSTRIVVLARQTVLRQSLLIAVGEILLTTVLLGALGFWLTRNLHAFVEGSRAIADGRYDLRLAERGRDEVGKLARNFNRMSVAVEQTVGQLRASEQRYRDLNEQLETRVEQRTAALQEAMDQLAETEKLASLGRIVAGVAHEMNTPIGNVILMTSTMEDMMAELLNNVQGSTVSRSQLLRQIAILQEELLIVRRSAQRAGSLIESFKRITVDQSLQRRRQFDLREMAGELLKALNGPIQRARADIAIDIPAGILVDSIPGHFEQVFSNLVSNSLLHGFEGRDGGTIHVSAALNSKGDWLEIVYQDDGNGIAAEAQAKIFEPFYTSRMGQGGSGLGLFIVHNLVYGALGGRLRLDSAPGQGVRFTFNLPINTPAA
ncbi:HAMP domain-containing protein [Oxalobacteraceae bacterium]|nr:HAMP domain-containing protein [Oxalobacteraceae bacterium]